MWWPGEWEEIISRVERWALKQNGYDKLRPLRLSKGYQSMVDHMGRSKKTYGSQYRMKMADEFHFSSLTPVHADKDGRCTSSSVYVDAGGYNKVDTVVDCQTNSRDVMNSLLERFDAKFSKLQKRTRTHVVANNNVDILNEECVKDLFAKCKGRIDRRCNNNSSGKEVVPL